MVISGLGVAMAILVGWLQEDPAKRVTVGALAIGFVFIGGLELLLSRAATLLPPGVPRSAIVIIPMAALAAGMFALGTRPHNWVDFAVAFLLGVIGLVLCGGLIIGMMLLWIRFAWPSD
jgi:protein-S-isoprenylcysteine O-methyltransferase Ste14